MAGIGKAKSPEKKVETVEQLLKDYETSVNKIRSILKGKPDKNSLSDSEKATLRSEYSNAARLALALSKRVTDEDQAKKYADDNKKLAKAAQSYGSVMKGTTPTTTFDDVKGLEDVKKLVLSFVYMSQNPKVLDYYHLEGGFGLLLYGAPGTGKTMFAEAVANKMDLPLFIVTPADIFKSYVGASEQAVRQIFDEIDACPDGAVLFVDECESIFSKRTDDTKDYKSAVTTELLQRLNGFGVDGSKRVLMAATNRPDMIDSAYLRHKRFSHLVHVPPPDATAKRAIIEGKLKGIALDGITIDEILMLSERPLIKNTAIGKAGERAYYSAADLCGALEEACRIALEQMQEKGLTEPIPLTREMLTKAFDKVPPSISQSVLDTYIKFR
ncbi:MAG: ATP-binding protein [Clostridia bacterium]|nr:ATP-binding protein [Clostridia bacterium]